MLGTLTTAALALTSLHTCSDVKSLYQRSDCCGPDSDGTALTSIFTLADGAHTVANLTDAPVTIRIDDKGLWNAEAESVEDMISALTYAQLHLDPINFVAVFLSASGRLSEFVSPDMRALDKVARAKWLHLRDGTPAYDKLRQLRIGPESVGRGVRTFLETQTLQLPYLMQVWQGIGAQVQLPDPAAFAQLMLARLQAAMLAESNLMFGYIIISFSALLDDFTIPTGSNAIALQSSRTADGRGPCMHMDPHNPILSPDSYLLGTFRMGDATWTGANLFGAGFPFGTNGHIAVGSTTANAANKDTYIETVVGRSPDGRCPVVRFRGHDVQANAVSMSFTAMTGVPEQEIVCFVPHHGPVLNEEGGTQALTWKHTYQDELAAVAEGQETVFTGAIHAKTTQGLLDALAAPTTFRVLGQAAAIVDVHDDARLVHIGIYPNRTSYNPDPARASDPLPGTGDYEWSGLMPHLYERAAKDGMVVTANQNEFAVHLRDRLGAPHWPQPVYGVSTSEEVDLARGMRAEILLDTLGTNSSEHTERSLADMAMNGGYNMIVKRVRDGIREHYVDVVDVDAELPSTHNTCFSNPTRASDIHESKTCDRVMRMVAVLAARDPNAHPVWPVRVAAVRVLQGTYAASEVRHALEVAKAHPNDGEPYRAHLRIKRQLVTDIFATLTGGMYVDGLTPGFTTRPVQGQRALGGMAQFRAAYEYDNATQTFVDLDTKDKESLSAWYVFATCYDPATEAWSSVINMATTAVGRDSWGTAAYDAGTVVSMANTHRSYRFA